MELGENSIKKIIHFTKDFEKVISVKEKGFFWILTEKIIINNILATE